MASEVTTILVTGASGHLGQLIVAQLLKQRSSPAVKIIAASRTPKKLEALQKEGAETRALDFADPASIAAAFKGVDRIVLISTDNLQQRIGQHRRAIEGAAQAGVKHVLYTSIFAPVPDLPLFDAHFYTEGILSQLPESIGFSIVREQLYSELLLLGFKGALHTGNHYSATGKGKRSYLSRPDLADAIAATILNISDLKERRLYNFTGTETFSQDELAAIVSDISGKKITHHSVPKDDFAKSLTAHVPPGLDAALAAVDDVTRTGVADFVTDDFKKATGHLPTSVKDFLTANKAAFL